VSWPLYQVDAFTAEPFAGNPAAVCLLEGGEDPGWMQQVAAEMNLSETAFLRPADLGTYALRWFTPAVEVELCGHATLASAHVLWTEGLAGEGRAVRFDTASGALTARPGGDGTIWLDFPATPAAPSTRPRGCWTPSGADRPATSGWDGSTTWSSWPTRRPCAG
jgi:predicted PhzF superfamily epimerase YddE/YHI9